MAEKFVDITIRANDAATAQVKKAADGIKKEVAGIDKLKAAFGEDSQFGKTLKALQGAGAVAGLNLAGQQLNKLTTKAVELRNEFDAGRLSVGGLVQELSKSLPVIGQFVQAGQNIREFFSRKEQRQSQANATKDAGTLLGEERGQIRNAGRLVGRSGSDLAREQLRQKFEAEKLAFELKSKESLKGVSGDQATELTKRQLEVAAERRKVYNAQRTELDRKDAEAGEKLLTEHYRKLADIERSAEVKKLQDSGRADAAAIEQARQATSKQQQEAIRAAQALGETRPEKERYAIFARAQDEVRLLERQGREEEERLRREHQRQERDEELAHAQEIQSIRKATYAETLRLSDQTAEAELYLLREGFQEQADAIRKAADDRIAQLKRYPEYIDGNRDKIARAERERDERLKALGQQQDAQELRLQRDETKRLADTRTDTQAQITQGRISLLQKEGDLGDALARKEAERLRIAEDYRQQQEQILRTLRDNADLTDAQRAAFRQQLFDLERQKAVAGAVAEAKARDPSTAPRPQLQEARFLGGLRGDRAFERSPLVEIASQAKRQFEKLTSIDRWLEKLASQRPEVARKGVFA